MLTGSDYQSVTNRRRVRLLNGRAPTALKRLGARPFSLALDKSPQTSGRDPRIKGTDLVALRKLFAERSAAELQHFLALLDAKEREGYETALHFNWLPAERVTRIFAAAAAVLFPGHAQGLRLLGQLVAARSFSGAYKLILSVPSLHFVVKRASMVWSWYHDLGRATIEDQSEHSLTLVVRGTPKLLWEMRELIAGHLLALAEATGTKHARVELENGDPNAWRWRIRWDPDST